jgi:hypothetical protein
MGLFSKISKKPATTSDSAEALPPPTTVASVSMPAPQVASAPAPIWLQTTGRFDLEVVGESHYFDALKRLTKGSAGETTLRATLARETTNKFDSGAVRVDVEGLPVGYLARDTAPEYHGLLDAVAARGGYAIVPALVWSSGDPRDFIASVRLDITDPALALPVNETPDTASARCWPAGKRVQLTEEADHMGTISSALRRAYEAGRLSAWLELAIPDDSDRVQVRLDGEQVGTLSGPTSKKFAPHIKRVQQAGRSVFALGEIKGNSLTAEITVSLANPEELSEDQIQTLLG